MKISDFLSAHVMIDVRASDKSRLLEQLSIQTAAEVGLAVEEVVREIAKREELGSTGVGNGVALPDARLQGLKALFGLLARLHRGIDVQAIDEQPVDVVFLLLLPESSNGSQPNALACVARAFRDVETLRRLRSVPYGEAAFLLSRVTLGQQDDRSKINEHYFVTGMVMEIGHEGAFGRCGAGPCSR